MDPAVAGNILYCSQCGQAKPAQELAHFGNTLVCAACKPAYAQRLSEGHTAAGAFRYAGFWIRFVAVIIDGLITGFASAAVQAILVPTLALGQPSATRATAFLGIAYLAAITISGAYESLFVYKFGATPGKMIFRLRVVRPDGGPISLPRAIGRYFAKMLSAIILAIGYIMAAFDNEKRALHDILVDTRVIKTRS